MKRLALRPSEWPITAKVPMLVVVLMLAVSAVITNQVLSRLAELQRRHFDELAASYLDGLSSSLVPAVLREDVWETFDILDRARSLYQGLKTTETVVANSRGTILAATDPVAHPLTLPSARRSTSASSRGKRFGTTRSGDRGRAAHAHLPRPRDWRDLCRIRRRRFVQ